MKHQGIGAHEFGTKKKEAHWIHLMLLVDPYDVFHIILSCLLSCWYGSFVMFVWFCCVKGIWVIVGDNIKKMCGRALGRILEHLRSSSRVLVAA